MTPASSWPRSTRWRDDRPRIDARTGRDRARDLDLYLTATHYADVAPVCTGLSDCLRVQRLVYAEWLGIPVALLGVGGYAGILAALVRDGEVRRLTAAFLALVGAGFSGYLTGAEAVRIEAFCQWCLVSAAIMVALAVLSSLRVLRG